MSDTMTKYELAEQLIKNRGVISKKAAIDLIETVMDLIICHFQNGGKKVAIRGFGSFNLVKRKSFVTTHPQVDESMVIEATKSISFKPSAETKRRINQ